MKGEISPYTRLRENIRELEREQARLRKGELPSQVADSLSSLDPGDIIAVPSGVTLGGSLSLTLAPTVREANGLAPLS